jgi:dephospho-CoA kinase
MRAKRWRVVMALTGGIGSGKSTVLGLLKEKGAFVVDSDVIVHDILEGGGRPVARLEKIAGMPLRRDGQFDRRALARVIFANPGRRRQVEGVLHPEVRRRIVRALNSRRGNAAVADIPLLFETGWGKRFRPIVVVAASQKTRLARLARRGVRPTDAKRRMAAQWPLARKVKAADFVIDNNGSMKDLKQNVNDFWKAITFRYLRGG